MCMPVYICMYSAMYNRLWPASTTRRQTWSAKNAFTANRYVYINVATYTYVYHIFLANWLFSFLSSCLIKNQTKSWMFAFLCTQPVNRDTQIYKYTYEHCWVMRRRIENLKIHATCCRDLYACCMPRRWSCSNYATAVKENIHNTCKEIYKQI